jgi:hypothetical protein
MWAVGVVLFELIVGQMPFCEDFFRHSQAVDAMLAEYPELDASCVYILISIRETTRQMLLERLEASPQAATYPRGLFDTVLDLLNPVAAERPSASAVLKRQFLRGYIGALLSQAPTTISSARFRLRLNGSSNGSS